MSNDFYNGSGSAIAPFTNARAEAVAAQFGLVAAGFDKLPSADDLAQARIGFLADTGTANNLLATLSPAPSTLVAGLTLRLRVLVAITGAATLNLNGLGPKSIIHAGGSPVVAGDLNADDIVELLYDGAAYRIMGGGSAADNAATRAQAAATSAINAPGTMATSTTSITIGTGTKVFGIQTGKQYAIGQTVSVAYRLDPTKQMVGIIQADPTTGSLNVLVSNTQGAGTFADWVIALSAITGSLTLGNVVGGGLATGGGNVGSNQTITVPAALAADILTGTDETKAVTASALWNSMGWLLLTDAATITPDFGLSQNFFATIAGTRLLANPLNMKVGQTGEIEITANGSNRDLTYGSAWKFPGGTPTLSKVNGAVDVISYKVRAIGGTPIIRAVVLKAFA